MSCYCSKNKDKQISDIECMNQTYAELRTARKLESTYKSNTRNNKFMKIDCEPTQFTSLREIAPKEPKADPFKYLGELVIFSQLISVLSVEHSKFALDKGVEDFGAYLEEYSRL